MIIAFDYDETWTNDPALWAGLAVKAKSSGHVIICITSRGKDTPKKTLKKTIGKYMPILYAAGDAKNVVAEKNGYSVDVWIDDNPESVVSRHRKKFTLLPQQ